MNLLARDAVRPRWYPPATVPAARVGIWAHDADVFPTFQTAEFIGWLSPGQESSIPFNPATDRPKVLRLVAYSASGVPSVRYLDDAPAVTVLFNRETSAPVVAQIGASTQGKIQLSVTGYSRFAVARRVRIADDAAMTVNVQTVIESAPLADVFELMRATSPGQSAQTVYVRLAHSASGNTGPWSPESAAQAFTFTAADGSGGSSGEGYEPWRYPYELI